MNFKTIIKEEKSKSVKSSADKNLEEFFIYASIAKDTTS